ncbi:MAG TPA: hypothetical protein VII30_03060 [Gemmatimonadaceae bacterium]
MSPDEAKKNAAQFLKDQAEIIKRYGKAPKLSGRGYQDVLNDTTKTFQSLSSAKKAK